MPANPPSAFAVNGLVELLALDGQRFLALERSYSQGGMTPGVSATTGKPTGNVIRLFLIDTASATNVAGWPSLRPRSTRREQASAARPHHASQRRRQPAGARQRSRV